MKYGSGRLAEMVLPLSASFFCSFVSPFPAYEAVTSIRQTFSFYDNRLVYVFINAYSYENSIQLFSMYLYSGMHWI